MAGGLIALQAPINAGLGNATGNVAAALVSFVAAKDDDRSQRPRPDELLAGTLVLVR